MVYICDVPTWASSARNARDEDMLASTYGMLATGKTDSDSTSRLSCNRDFVSVPVYLAESKKESREERQRNFVGKRVATMIMMAMAMAIAITLVWHVTESDASLEWRRTQHSPAVPTIGIIAHAAHSEEPRDTDKPRARRRLADVHETLDQDFIEPPRITRKKPRRRAHRQQPIQEPGFKEVAEGQAAHHLDRSSPMLRLYRAEERDEVEHPKLFEAPVEPPSAEDLLKPWHPSSMPDLD